MDRSRTAVDLLAAGSAPADPLPGLWADLGGATAPLGAVTTTGPAGLLPSVFDVTGFAVAAVGAAALAVAELWSVRTGAPVPGVVVDRAVAASAFRAETRFSPDGWTLPPVWDAVAGDYRTAEGWIRLHTNYASHRAAVLTVLGTAAEREAVGAAVARWRADELEAAVVGAGGCAAALRSASAWAAHPAGLATAGEAPVRLGGPVPVTGGAAPDLAAPPGARPLAGVRVLDLTRVIAGPVATRYLAAYGADVVRVDPPGFEEVGALLPETTAGKRCVALDLGRPDDRRRFEALVAEAHLVVSGLRPGALAALGYDPAGLRAMNPSIVTVTHDAYGWDGPWAGRRGFDSLVQMSTGIAAAGMAAAGADRPVPLPVQALDHGVGHLLAAGACRALTRLVTDGVAADVRGSLVGAANVVSARPASAAPVGQPADGDDVALEPAATAWGPARRAPLAGAIDGHRPRWDIEAGPLGRHPPRWTAR